MIRKIYKLSLFFQDLYDKIWMYKINRGGSIRPRNGKERIMKICPNCHAQNDDADRICFNCNQPLDAQREPQQQYHQPQQQYHQPQQQYHQPQQNYYQNTPPVITDASQLPLQFRPLSPWAYFGYSLLFSIPIVGFILLIVFSFSDSNINRRNYARSYFCLLLIVAIIFAVMALLSLALGYSLFAFMR